jgi:hypothetical protein
MLSRISKISRAAGTGDLVRSVSCSVSAFKWHFLYFLPLPHQQGAFLRSLSTGLVAPRSVYRCLSEQANPFGLRAVNNSGESPLMSPPRAT